MIGARSLRAALIATSLALTVGGLAIRFQSLATRQFDPDELEHAHVAWYVAQGEVPYRDFFEVHTPVFYYLLAGIVGPMHPEQSGQAGLATLLMARRFTWMVSVAVIALTWLLARRIRGSTTAWVALPLVSLSIIVALRAPEIRPDGLSTCLWLSCLLFLDAAMRALKPASASTRALFVLSGLSIGLGVLTSQKLLLIGPSLAATVVWYLVTKDNVASLAVRLGNVACQAAAVIACWAGAWFFFSQHGAADEFVHRTLLGNLEWIQESTPATVLAFIAQYDPWLLALAGGGVVAILAEVLSAVRGRTPAVLLLFNTAGAFAGLYLSPVPFPQYALTFVPLFAILAATWLVAVAERAQWRVRAPIDRWASVIAFVIVVLVAVAALKTARPQVLHPALYPVTLAIAALGLVLAPRVPPSMALTTALLALSLYPLQWSTWLAGVRDDRQYAAIRYVLDASPVDATVMDGWSGYGVFRRHAWFYWMLHPGVRGTLRPDEVRAVELGLENGSVAPDLIVLDDDLMDVSPVLTEHVRRAYRPTPIDRLFARGP